MIEDNGFMIYKGLIQKERTSYEPYYIYSQKEWSDYGNSELKRGEMICEMSIPYGKIMSKTQSRTRTWIHVP